MARPAFPSREGQPLFIPETGFTVLNHLYYARLSEILYPILQQNKKGLIAVATVREARRLAKFLNWAFQKAHFSVHYKGLSAEEKQDILQDLNQSPLPHYLIVVQNLNVNTSLSQLTAYIDLNVNVPAQKQIDHFFSQKNQIPLAKNVLLLTNQQNQEMRKGLLNALETKKSAPLNNQPLSALDEIFDLGWRGRPQLAQTMPGLARLEEELLTTVLAASSQIKGRAVSKKNGKIARKKEATSQRAVNKWSFAPYEKARKRVQEAGLKSPEEYLKWQKSHKNMPSIPLVFYRNKGWVSWEKFLGTEQTISSSFVSYEEAQKRVQNQGITSARQYKEWQKSQKDMPSNPNETYRKQGWITWGEFLGTGRT